MVGVIHISSLDSRGVIKVKVKFTLEQTTKALRGSRGYLYSFFDLSVRYVWMVNATPRPLYPWETEPVPIV